MKLRLLCRDGRWLDLAERDRWSEAGYEWQARPRDPKRDAEILRLRRAGLSQRAIGLQCGLSATRVRQIIGRDTS
jgi:hypothetical protein